MRQNKPKTQLDKVNNAFIAISSDVTAEDKKAAQLELTVSRYTVNSYLKGEAKDIELAMNLLKFFKKRIAARDKELTKAMA
ncbi:hypothetical protein [Cnuella takakiae]|uniref:hypothetical protein n=1 Tax=Cnuella takakiae TaxID=1302690 RepID=UPI001160E1EB|nr:hypothetical protein [Cnuella takakiae]